MRKVRDSLTDTSWIRTRSTDRLAACSHATTSGVRALRLTGVTGVNVLLEASLPSKTTWPTPVKWRALFRVTPTSRRSRRRRATCQESPWRG